MELRQLEYFAAIARHRNFTRAAAELWVTQSALSQQVRRLARDDALAPFTRAVAAAIFAIPPGARPGGFVGDALFERD